MTKRIVVVDDDKDILDALTTMLIVSDFAVAATTKGEELRTMITRHNPDLILLDVLLSGIDGRDICKSLKADAITKHIPVIMISAHPDAERSTKEAGADCFVAKPFDMEHLMNRIQKHLTVN